ncbi:helicase-related protein [Kocuria sp. cx-116]|uniref:helicase-related protein n=1 Tax=Kocuria sp. cx-116 TaxID=2771378 RepID=UPI003FA57B3D
MAVEASAELKDYIEEIGRRAEAIAARLVDRHEDNMLKISSDGRKAALDMRLVDPELGSIVAETKVSVTADLVAQVHEEHKDDVFLDTASGEEHPTRGALQIVFCDQSTPSTEKWNVYDELKAQLVKRGVPAEKIRFMHEAKNDAEKGRLFSAARSGEVAVLLGSTQRMGVGTNIQARAVHLVDLDAPWRPADVAQRHGRIVRQGNQNAEVAISQVVTKGSFDTFMWQTLERKSKFIDQIMRGRLDVREIEDLGDNTLSFAEVKAISSGNPLILEKSKAGQELTRLERLNRAWHRNQSSLVFRKDAAAARADALENELPAIQAAVQRTTDELGGEKFRMTIDGVTYDKRTEAAQAWQRWAGVHASSRPPRAGEIDLGVAGQIGGHDIRVVQRPGNLTDLGASTVELRIDDAPGVTVDVTRATSLNPSVGMIQRLENQVRALPEEVTKRQARLASARQEAEDARQALDVPFKHQDALEAARWEAERIGRAMRGEQTPQPTLGPELEALKKRMRVDFPDAPTAGGSGGARGGTSSGRPSEAALAHDDLRTREGELEL